MTLEELRARLKEITSEAKNLNDKLADTTITAETRSVYNADWDKLMAEAETVKDSIKREMRLKNIKQFGDEPEDDEPNPEDGEVRGGGDVPDDEIRSFLPASTAAMKKAEDEFRFMWNKAFEWRWREDKMPTEFRNKWREVCQKRAQTVGKAAGADDTGNIFVPTVVLGEIARRLKQIMPVMDKWRNMPTRGGGELKLPYNDNTDEQAAARAELAATGAGADITFTGVSLMAYGYSTGRIDVSRELIMDSPVVLEGFTTIEEFVIDCLVERCYYRISEATTTGTGVGQPQGLETAIDTGITAAAQTTLTLQEINRMTGVIKAPYSKMPGICAMMNTNTFTALKGLSIARDNKMQSAGELLTDPDPNINGKMILINEYMPDMAAGKSPIVYGNFNQFIFRMVGDIMIGVHYENKWPDIQIEAYFRFDSRLWHKNGLTKITMAA